MITDPEDLTQQALIDSSVTTQSEDVSNTTENLLQMQLEIERRCKIAKIKTSPELINEETKLYIVQFPVGNETQNIYIKGMKSAKVFLSIPFEDFFGVPDYRAIYSHKNNTIEALLASNRPLSALMRMLSAEYAQTNDVNNITRSTLTSEDDQYKDIQITIGPATNTFSILDGLSQISGFIRSDMLRDQGFRGYTTIIIEGIQIRNGQHAKELLESVANSVLFQIDSLFNIPTYLPTRNIEGARSTRSALRTSEREKDSKLTFPKYHYDPQPMSLYWYASTAERMPLLQYLAYYQVIEYYFPRFAEQETHEIIKRKLKDPTFESRLDENIAKLLDSIKPLIGKGSYGGDERQQLLATMKACISSEDLYFFFKDDEERLNFFKTKWKNVTYQKIQIPTENPKAEKGDIINDTANRIYEIRCKIVHTKSSDNYGQNELLLPYSKEAQQLGHDIDLIHFVARNVLIASAKSLKLR